MKYFGQVQNQNEALPLQTVEAPANAKFKTNYNTDLRKGRLQCEIHDYAHTVQQDDLKGMDTFGNYSKYIVAEKLTW